MPQSPASSMILGAVVAGLLGVTLWLYNEQDPLAGGLALDGPVRVAAQH